MFTSPDRGSVRERIATTLAMFALSLTLLSGCSSAAQEAAPNSAHPTLTDKSPITTTAEVPSPSAEVQLVKTAEPLATAGVVADVPLPNPAEQKGDVAPGSVKATAEAEMATSLPPTATPAALPLPEAGGPITTTAEITGTVAISETVPLVVEAPEIGVDVIKVLTEVERVGQEMGLSLVADIDNSFTMEIPAVDENGNKIILRKTVRSIAVRLLPNNGDNTPQDLNVLLENAKSFPEEESARVGKLLTRGFRALVEDGYDPTQIRFFGKADLMGTEVYLTVAVKDVDKFAQILNGKGAASMGHMSRVPSSGLFALSGKGFFIDAGGMWDPDDPENSSFRDFFLQNLSMGVSHLVGSDKVKDFKGLQPYIATNAYFTAAQKSPEDFRKTVERINNLVFGGEGGLDAEDYLGGN